MGVLVSAALLPSGCALLQPGSEPMILPEPSAAPASSAAPPASDAPVPYTLRAAVEPARAALERGWPHPEAVRFRFLEGRCAIGGAAVLLFEQDVTSQPPLTALALTHDVAAGIMTGAWWERYDLADPDVDPDLVGVLSGREYACP